MFCFLHLFYFYFLCIPIHRPCWPSSEFLSLTAKCLHCFPTSKYLKTTPERKKNGDGERKSMVRFNFHSAFRLLKCGVLFISFSCFFAMQRCIQIKHTFQSEFFVLVVFFVPSIHRVSPLDLFYFHSLGNVFLFVWTELNVPLFGLAPCMPICFPLTLVIHCLRLPLMVPCA